MTRSRTLLVVLALAVFVTNATATTPAPAAKTIHRTHVAAASKPRPSATAARRISDVHIEGEMPVPQVLFITARDQRRYVDFQHQHYLRDSKTLSTATPVPDRVTTTRDDHH